jgi:hypothetical protein
MALAKLSLQHVVGQWDRRGIAPIVSNWASVEQQFAVVVNGDNVIVNSWSREDLTGTETDLVLTGATALRCILRATKDATSVIYGFQAAYNQGVYAAGEDLAAGKVTWLLSVGPLAYPVAGVTTGTKTLTIAGDYHGQFASGDAITISGSTGNDGSYILASAPTYSAGTGQTSLVVTGTLASAVADGSINHSALQHATFNSSGYLDAYLECSWIDASGNPQTLLPAFPVHIQAQLDTGQEGIAAGAAPTYLTAAEIAAAYALLVGSADIEITDATKGVIFKVGSARHRLTLVSDGGVITTNISDPL